VVETVAIFRKGGHGRGPFIAIGCKILRENWPCQRVGLVFAVRREVLSPGEFGAVQTDTRGKLPFGFGRRHLAAPGRVGFGIAIGDAHDRMVVEAADRAARPVRPSPIGAELELPPLRIVAQINRSARAAKISKPALSISGSAPDNPSLRAEARRA